MPFSSVEELLLVAAIVALGQIVYALAGFGSGMVSVSLFALAFGDLKFFVPMFLLLCLPTEVAVTWQSRSLQDWRRTALVLAAALPTLALGAWLLGAVDSSRLAFFLGLLIVVLGLYYLLLEARLRFSFTQKWHLLAASATGGILGGLFGVAGPPLILYFKSLRLDKDAFRAALIGIWLCMTCVKIPMYAGLGLYSVRSLWWALVLLPASFAGARAGMLLHQRVSEAAFRRFTSLLLIASGVLLALQNRP
ncbi:sulfite exporter TauE/SafE family protein [Myxococcota bacterium]|nr:sulfite exporter TauE/SafE family protein [Myxococcota bacterium]MBU1410755.1 sulfite exporter TauE/SafE family protein [Myxococcota bacterium]